VDQTRGWFYSLLAIATTVFDSPAYRNVVVNELVLDAQGQKMSKTRGNVADPGAAIREFGADTVRLYLLASSQVWAPRRFDSRGIAEQQGFLNTLKQTYRFYSLYASTEKGEPRTENGTALQLSALDKWILARLDALVEGVTAAWEAYQVTDGVRDIVRFVVDDLSNWYVRLSRARFWAPDRDADAAAVATLRECLTTVVRLLAPAAPFAADWIHRALTGQSVHLSPFPASGDRRNEPLERAMAAARTLASLGRAARETRNIRVRQPLATMRVAVPAGIRGAEFEGLLPLVQSEVNVREVRPVDSDADLVRLRAKPNFRALGKRFGKRTQEAAAAVATLDVEALRVLENGGTVLLAGLEVTRDEVAVEREVTSDWLVQSDGPYVVALDPELSGELRAEGLAREVVSRVQRMRKEAGYEYTTRIRLWVRGADAIEQAVRHHAGFIAEETLARALVIGDTAEAPDLEQQLDLEGATALVAIRREAGN
jgi:isoleucyl-tRNA synthetase